MDIREIAKRAQVFIATVFRAIDHFPTVNPQPARRVWNEIEQLNCYPNTEAWAFVSGCSRIFGVIKNAYFEQAMDKDQL